ncbi:GreA/GreB family elongation factor [Fibrella sp. HMF5335]|uniref:GreA/GreB family elongation factor n=1 Tax=Fibrella rubiginis TaxID=2817060 RepID=A0A939GM29_9BACT|nr:GreA/GreB family elongation factor [Fibrella rubiginis]MBO0939905.1 GreA/GreB family elongation factor [Fibrella rubiginis]
MSSAFLKNETADAPVVIPARAPLPPGTSNYVTPRGLALLRQELAELETERVSVQHTAPDETERTRQLALINGRVGALNQRIASASVVDPATQPHTEVRFGATVTLQPKKGPDRTLTIVGVDEADASHGRVAFTAPIARAMQGKRIGDSVALRTMKGEETYTIAAIDYGF